jgi:hypothetical protein
MKRDDLLVRVQLRIVAARRGLRVHPNTKNDTNSERDQKHFHES